MWRLRVRFALRRAVVRLPLRLSRYLLLLQEYRRIPRIAKPRTFNEKVNHRIVYDRREILRIASSKVDSKAYVEQLGTGVYVPRTYWVGTDIDELAGLRVATQWVLKASHRSGRLIHGNPGPIDPRQLELDVAEWLADAEYAGNRLWGYREVRKELILEERVGAPESFPDDLKFFVFDGRVEMIQVDHARGVNHTRNLYTATWQALDWVYTWPRGPVEEPPENLAQLLEIAKELGAGFDFVRVDLYNVDGQPVFGELTVYPGAGLSPWPPALDFALGDKWILPSHEKRG